MSKPPVYRDAYLFAGTKPNDATSTGQEPPWCQPMERAGIGWDSRCKSLQPRCGGPCNSRNQRRIGWDERQRQSKSEDAVESNPIGIKGGDHVDQKEPRRGFGESRCPCTSGLLGPSRNLHECPCRPTSLLPRS